MKNLLAIPCLLFCLAGCAQSTINSTSKIPINSLRWYQMNYTKGTLSNLFDGNVNTSAFTGWAKIINNYDAYYPLIPGKV